MDGWMDGRTDGQTDGQMDQWTNGPTDGPTKRGVESRSTQLGINLQILSFSKFLKLSFIDFEI